MAKIKITEETIQKIYEDSSVYTADYLKNHFNCSHQCLWNNLKKVGYYSSFTHNSKYYTLANIPEFNDNGIWFHKVPSVGEVGFTNQKTAPNLIISLINSSKAGLSEGEITDIMKIRISNQLISLVKKAKIRKLRIENKVYYVSIDEKIYRKQYVELAEAKDSSVKTQSLSLSIYKQKIKRLTAARDSWCERSNEKQKTIRKHLTRIRDLERSRNKWKNMAMKYKNMAQQLKGELEKIKKNSSMDIL